MSHYFKHTQNHRSQQCRHTSGELPKITELDNVVGHEVIFIAAKRTPNHRRSWRCCRTCGNLHCCERGTDRSFWTVQSKDKLRSIGMLSLLMDRFSNFIGSRYCDLKTFWWLAKKCQPLPTSKMLYKTGTAETKNEIRSNPWKKAAILKWKCNIKLSLYAYNLFNLTEGNRQCQAKLRILLPYGIEIEQFYKMIIFLWEQTCLPCTASPMVRRCVFRPSTFWRRMRWRVWCKWSAEWRGKTTSPSNTESGHFMLFHYYYY